MPKLIAILQHLLPKFLLTSFVYKLTRIETTWFKNGFIKLFIKMFNVDMETAKLKNAEDFNSFNEFFTREINVPPILEANTNSIVSPVEGTVSQIGNITNGKIIQAKGINYSLDELLAYDEESNLFRNGLFATLYLSPKNYHRIHMPCDGKLSKMHYVPGELFGVGNWCVAGIPSLFARNERVINYFDTEFGKVAVVFVGAVCVGSMETVWHGQITPAQPHISLTRSYSDEDLSFKQGDEIGRFNMGSTVILVLEKKAINWDKDKEAETPLNLGELLGSK